MITDPLYSGFEFTGPPSDYRQALHPYLDEIKRCVRDLRIAVSQPGGHIHQVKGETVLDPFCGSGAIGIACLLLGRN